MPHRPVLLGVVGDSAAGKTTLCDGIAAVLDADRVTVVCADDYHRYDRQQRKTLGITPLHPDCNYLDVLEQHVRALADGQAILKPVYDHATGSFAPPVYVRPGKFVVVEGLLAFHSAALRDCFHVKVYLDPPEPLRRQWKMSRDCTKRGYAPAEVLAELERREPDSEQFIRPQRRWADLVVRFQPPHASGDAIDPSAVDPARLDARLTMRSTLAQPDLDGVAARDGGAGFVRLSVMRDGGRLAEVLDIDGDVSADAAAAVENAVWAHEPELRGMLRADLGTFVVGRERRRSRPLALAQLIAAYHLLVSRIEKDRVLARLAERAQRDAAALAALLGSGELRAATDAART